MPGSDFRGSNYFLVILILPILLGLFIIIRCGNEMGGVDEWSVEPELVDEIEVVQEGGVLRAIM